MAKKQNKLDQIDFRILEEIQENGRVSNVELSKKIHLSPAPCLERMRKLENQGHIQGYTGRINPATALLGVQVLVEISLEHNGAGVYDDFHANIIPHEEVYAIYQIAGDFDYIVKIRTYDMTSFRNFLWQVLAIAPGVKSTRSHVVMETIYERNTLSLKYLKDSIE